MAAAGRAIVYVFDPEVHSVSDVQVNIQDNAPAMGNVKEWGDFVNQNAGTTQELGTFGIPSLRLTSPTDSLEPRLAQFLKDNGLDNFGSILVVHGLTTVEQCALLTQVDLVNGMQVPHHSALAFTTFIEKAKAVDGWKARAEELGVRPLINLETLPSLVRDALSGKRTRVTEKESLLVLNELLALGGTHGKQAGGQDLIAFIGGPTGSGKSSAIKRARGLPIGVRVDRRGSECRGR